MQFVEGEKFLSQSEYEQALSDKKLIDEIKASFDLTNPKDIEKAYSYVQSIHFKTVVGDKFDDYIYELHLKNKGSSQIREKEENSTKTKTVESKKTNSSLNKPMDSKTRKAVIKELKRQNRNRSLVICFLLLLAFSSIGYFVLYYAKQRDVINETSYWAELKDEKYANVISSVSQVIRKDYEEAVVIPEILDEYKALYNKNKSLIGWIKIADTIIDYPVMQTVDNEYYLKHNFNQETNNNGCIFMDCNNDVILGNTNFILYGHHMKTGAMFGTLKKYANQDYYEEHKIIEFDTIYEKGTYEVMYAFRSRIYNKDEIIFKYYQFIDAYSAEEFDSYMEEMDKLSLIDTGVTASFGDKLLTLSTCDYQENNGRFVVVAKRID